ncbi:guanylate-binding protein [Paraphysoderma sedebokerense]|nr:guanylate-binding protein [Paraphysoderma sedebokerense]
MDKPIPFITVKPSQNPSSPSSADSAKFQLHKPALELLSKIEGNIAVVTIAGLYRTGKSYILNRLAGSSRGFAIGSFVEPCTQGIHMWIVKSPPPPAEQHGIPWPENTTLVLLDTEGLGSYTKSKTYDIKIFALSVLLSSIFIYNSMGSIDEGALDRLSLVAELSNNIKMQSDSDDQDPYQLARFFPKFLWLVRDFSLKLELDGKQISSTDYLENTLKPLQGDPERVKSRNLIRNSITQYFPDRHCFTIKRPVTDEKLLQKLEEITESELRPQFLEQVNDLMKMIFGMVQPKKLFGETLNGRMFVQLATSYIDAINTGGVPTIRSAWDNIVEAECQRTLTTVTEHYEKLWAQKVNFEKSALEVEELEKIWYECVKEVTMMFRKAVGGKGPSVLEWEQKLSDYLRDHYNLQKQANAKKSQKSCEELIDSLCQSIEVTINQDDKITIEGLQTLWNQVVAEKYIPTGKGPAKHEILNSFIQKRGFEHAGRVHRKLIKKLEEEHEKSITTHLSTAQTNYANLEKMYNDVKTSWLRSRDEVRDLETENSKLIDVVARFSDVVNDEMLRKK